MEGSWFTPQQLQGMQKEFGLSPLATELIGQAPQMLKHLQGMGGGGGTDAGLMSMLGGGKSGYNKGGAGERKDKLLALIMANMGQQATAPSPLDIGGGFGVGY